MSRPRSGTLPYLLPALLCGLGLLCAARASEGRESEPAALAKLGKKIEKDVPGELEAVILVIRNGRTGDAITLVDKVASPDCASSIPPETSGVSCSGRFEIEAAPPASPSGAAESPALCIFDRLDDVNRIARTPASQNLVLTDVEGRRCKAVAKESDQWRMQVQSCCARAPELGEAGDPLITTARLVIDHAGTCIVNEMRPERGAKKLAETASTDAGACL